MKVLFDNNVPVGLRRHLVGHEVRTAAKLGWRELQNGDLLVAAEQAGFDVMVTGDKNLSYQQNLAGRKLALVVLATNNWGFLKENSAPVVAAVNRAEPGSFQAVRFENLPTRRRRGPSLDL
ncbi:MAG: hypothetical protein M3Y72_18830 [Acidobacteriota bacterium]|nr:hypothetical protein [Acidobacteriota bacterium]